MTDDPTRPARVMIVDDHAIVRHGLRLLLEAEAGVRVSGEAGSAEEALKRLHFEAPDVLIVDLALEGSSGLDLVQQAAARYPRLPILVLSMHDELLYAERAFRAGARGYLMKHEATKRIVTAIRRLLEGAPYVSERVQGMLMERTRPGGRRHSGAVLQTLSDREFEVFRLIGLGFGTSEIAAKLGRSVKTIEAHRAKLKEKLGMRRGTELARFAIQWNAREGDEGDEITGPRVR